MRLCGRTKVHGPSLHRSHAAPRRAPVRYGQSEEIALGMLRAVLPPTAILVGMNIRKDIEWLGLVEERDYAQCIDLSDLFRVWNPAKGSYTYFGLDHITATWLNMPRQGLTTPEPFFSLTLPLVFFVRACLETSHVRSIAACPFFLVMPCSPSPPL